MRAGLAKRISRLGQLRAGDEGGGLENEIRLGLTIDSDTIPTHTIENSAQEIQPPPTQDADTIPTLSLAYVAELPVVVDADQVGNPQLDMNAVLPAFQDTDTVPNPTVAPGAVAITVPAVQDADTVNQPTLAPGAVTIAPPAVQDADTIPALTVALGAGLSIEVPAVQDTDSVQNLQLDMNVTVPATQDVDTVPNPSLAAVIAPPAVQDADTIPQPTIDMNLALPATQDADTVPTHNFDMSLAVPAVQDADTIPTHDVALGGAAQPITVPATQDTDTIPTHVVAPGAVTVTVPAVADADTIPTHTVALPATTPSVLNTTSASDSTSDNTTATMNFTPNSGVDYVIVQVIYQGSQSSDTAATFTCDYGATTDIDQLADARGLQRIGQPNCVIFGVKTTSTAQVTIQADTTEDCDSITIIATALQDVGGSDAADAVDVAGEESITPAVTSNTYDIVTTVDGCLIIGSHGIQSRTSDPFTPGTDYTEIADGESGGSQFFDHGYHAQHRDAATAGTFAFDASWADTKQGTSACVALKPG